MRQNLTLGTRGEAQKRVCTEPGCGTHLAKRNPASYCWLHGGWDGREFGDAIRAFLAAIAEAQPKARHYEPSLVAMRRWQRKWGKHSDAVEEVAA